MISLKHMKIIQEESVKLGPELAIRNLTEKSLWLTLELQRYPNRYTKERLINQLAQVLVGAAQVSQHFERAAVDQAIDQAVRYMLTASKKISEKGGKD